MNFEHDSLGKFVNFSNGKSSPERSDDFDNPVFGSNGLIGYAEATNSPANTAVIGRVGSYCGSIHFTKNACWVTDNAIKATAKTPEESRFWYYAMLNRDLHDLRAGSGQPLINQTSLKAVLLPVPDPDDRLEIAATLGALDDKIEVNRRTAVTLEEMARALYQSWFIDFDPVLAKAAGHAPVHMDAQTAALFPDSFGEDGLPEGWGFEELGSFCTQGKTTVKPMQQLDQLFQHFSLPAFDTGQSAPFELGANIKSNKVFVPDNAILFSRLNPRIPRVWWAKTTPGEGIPVCSTEFFVAEVGSPDAVPHLYCLLSSDAFFVDALSRVGGTSGSHQRVSPAALKGIEIVAPPEEIIGAFGKLSQSWFDKIHLFARENQTLAALRDTLLPRLMSGELRVGEAKEQVEAVA